MGRDIILWSGIINLTDFETWHPVALPCMQAMHYISQFIISGLVIILKTTEIAQLTYPPKAGLYT